MAQWVWYSGRERQKHLALMRSSAASRRFARLSLLLVSVGVALLETSRTGWRWVSAMAEIEPSKSTEPRGVGWLHVAGIPPTDSEPGAVVDLWWNPIQTAVTLAVALLLGFVVCCLVVRLLRVGVMQAHRPPYAGDERMTAAVHYSTAWGILLSIAGLIAAFRPVGFIGAMQRWPWYPPDEGFLLSAAVVAGFGVMMWWFWLIRLGATAPAKTRRSVVVFFTVTTPLIVIATGVGWWFGIPVLFSFLFERMKLMF